MRRALVLLSAFSMSFASLAACEDTASSPTEPALHFDAAMPDSGSSGFDAAGNPETGPSPVSDAGVDAEADAGSDAGVLNALFAHINEQLVRVNPDTGAVTDVASTGEPWIVLAWDHVAKVARVIVDVYSPAGGAATPKLGTIDLCTGVITTGPAITLGGTQVRRAESLVQDPSTGTWFIGFGTSGTSTSTQYLSERNGTVDVATGAVTAIGMHDTVQDDADVMTFVGPSLRLLDVAVVNGAGALYVVDKVTGAASAPITTPANMRRVAYDPTRDVVFTTAGNGDDPNATARSVGKLDLTTGANTPIGTTLAAGQYGDVHFNGLVSVPPPICP